MRAFIGVAQLQMAYLQGGKRHVFTRGIPYAPRGTVQDFSHSPRHAGLYRQQEEFDRRSGRDGTNGGVYDGASYIPGVGAQPSKHLPFQRRMVKPPPRFGDPARHQLQQQQQGRGRGRHRPAIEELMPPLVDGYQEDLRAGGAPDGEPEHITAAKQSLINYQSDSYGNVARGVVPPPPPVDSSQGFREYRQPAVELDELWWVLVICFIVLFVIMASWGT